MKLLAINKFYFIKGGSDRCFFALNGLIQHNGHSVIPFAMKHPKNKPSNYEDYFVSEVDFWATDRLFDKLKAAGRILYSREAARKVESLVDDTQPDIAHLHLIYHQISPSILPVLKRQGIPIVQTLHDYKPICGTYSLLSGNEICERCKGNRHYNATLQRCNKGSLPASMLTSMEMYLHHSLGWYDLPDIYIAPSDFMRRKMIEFGMSPEKLVHIPNFVDPKEFLYSNQQENYFLYAGRLAPTKGIKTLLNAMKKLKGINVQLLIVGDGPQRSQLEAIKERHELDNVTFLGFQATHKLKALMGNALFTVLPSEWYENCPMAALESMAIGKPVLGADIGGIPELINQDQDGLLFTPGNSEDLTEKLQQLIQNPTHCLEMGKIARQKIEERYAPHVHYKETVALYERLGVAV